MKTKIALITGVTGQDGAYLAEFLLDKGYEVHGIKRRTSLFNTDRIDHLYQDPHVANRRFTLHHGDMTDSSSLVRIIQQVQPDEIYNLAAQSHVAVVQDEAPVLLVRVLVEVIDAVGIEQGGAALDAMHIVALVEEELGQIGAVLSGDAGNQCCFLGHCLRP